nr:C2H2-type zinc finger protein [Endozoicomonas sp.]
GFSRCDSSGFSRCDSSGFSRCDSSGFSRCDSSGFSRCDSSGFNSSEDSRSDSKSQTSQQESLAVVADGAKNTGATDSEKTCMWGNCEKSHFSTDDDYYEHLKEHAKNHSSTVCQWDDCCKKFASQKGLKTHLLNHGGEKRFVCKECNKAFSQQNHLNNHATTHTRETPFECTVCSRKTNTAANARSHFLRRHNTSDRSRRMYFRTDRPAAVNSRKRNGANKSSSTL